MFGIDEIYDELLLEAKSPEEIRKILMYQFVDGKGVPVDVFNNIFNSDPTRKKTYTKWALIQWGNVNERENILKAVLDNKIGPMFEYFQKRANDGLNLLGINSFSEALSMVPQKDNDPIFGDKDKGGRENDYDIVYDSQDWRIAIPNTVEASEKLGRGCKWCTAGYYGNAEHYFNRYNSKGKLWVNFDKRKSEIGPSDNIEYPYTRYQFCFEVSPPELQDAENLRIDFEGMDMPDEVLEFYRSEDEDYAEDLEYSSNSDEAINRRNMRRLENCILRREGQGSDLVLLPNVDDETTYSFYSTEDVTDPIDTKVYNGIEDVAIACEGYPLVIMKTQDDNYVVYRETSYVTHYNGNMVNYYWQSLDDLSALGGNENVVFFIDYFVETLHYAFKSSPNNVLAFDFDKHDAFSDAESVTEVKFENIPPKYSGAIMLSVEHENKLMSLLCLNPSTSELEIIIERDMPFNDKDFYIDVDDNVYYIQCKTRKYVLEGDDNESNNVPYKMHAKLEYEGYYIVSYNDEDSPTTISYGIYSVKNWENRIIVKGFIDYTDYEEVVLLKYNNYSVFYSLDDEKEVGERGLNFKEIGSYLVSYNPLSNTNASKVLQTYPLKDVGPFDKVLSCLAYSYLLVEKDGINQIYDIDFNKFPLPNGTSYIKSIDRSFFVVSYNNTLYAYSGEKGEVISKLKDEDSIKVFPSKDRYVPTYTIERPDNKVILANSHGDVFPENGFDEIIAARNQVNFDPIVIGYRENNKVFFMVGKKHIRPTKDGISSEYYLAHSFAENRNDLTEVPNIVLTIKFNNTHYGILYNTYKNTIDAIADSNNEEVTDSNIIKEIEKIIFPNKAQISEHFNNLLDRMNNL